jgi:DNA-binding LytR/AlgR family response regulator
MNWNGSITVISPQDDGQTLHSVPLDEFLFFEVEQRQIWGHTAYGVYRLPWNSLKVLHNLVQASAEGFEKADKACVVNVRKIKRLDPELGVAHFAGCDGRDKTCFVAECHIKRLQALLDKLHRNRHPDALQN